MVFKYQFYASLLLIFTGIFLAFGAWLDIKIWAIILPWILILIGSWWLTHKKGDIHENDFHFKFIGLTQREGIWPVKQQAIVTVTGDIILDLTRADIPDGETKFHISGVIGNIILRIPKNVGVTFSSLSMATEAKFLEQEHHSMFLPLQLTDSNYQHTNKKINLETMFFVSEVRISQV
ncbi:MAG: hypothetical protein JEZ06_12390 [Anaerolineaceae bacterium]|nr:hypothetical protein [Anaerolineaceae bacterium]